MPKSKSNRRGGAKRKGGRRLGRAVDPRIMQGAGFFGDLWSGIKKVGSVVNDGLKETKLISGFLLPKVPYIGNVAADFARSHGYGRRRGGSRGGLAVTRT